MKKMLFLLGGLGLLALLAFQLFPLLVIVLTGLRSPVSLMEFGVFSLQGLGWEAFQTLFSEHEMLSALGSSVLISSTASFLSVVAAAAFSYACTQLRFRLGGGLLLAIVGTRLIPPAALILPLFILLKSWSLTDSHLGLILAHTALNIPFCVWLLVPFFRAIPAEIGQAAEVDGMTPFQKFRLVFLPLALPGLMVAAVFSFLMSWNDFLLSLVLAGSAVKTAPLLVNGFMTGFGPEWGSMAAASLLMLVPVFALSWLLQGRIVGGLTAGGVK